MAGQRRLSVDMLIAAYTQGVFPMADEDGIWWYDPDPRAIIPLDTVHISRRLARTVRNGPFELRVDTAFAEVMRRCAAPGPGREHSWIAPEFVRAYTQLHRLGLAHSVEAWREGFLVGGLYGVAIRGLFAGESMFSAERDASKVAFVHLVRILRGGGFVLLDTQFSNPHIAQFGVREIPRDEYKQLLAEALTVNARFDSSALGEEKA